jgi:hypothetical protein
MDDMNDQVFRKVTEDMDPFKKILTRVPGFSGYIERENRRESDKLIRERLSQRFRELEGRISKLQRDFISQGEIKYVDDLEATAIKLRTFADRVRLATRGYSGLFDAVKINEAELARLYAHDAAMFDLTDQMDHAIDNVEASVGTDGLPAAIRNLETNARQSIETFDRREEVFIDASSPSTEG